MAAGVFIGPAPGAAAGVLRKGAGVFAFVDSILSVMTDAGPRTYDIYKDTLCTYS